MKILPKRAFVISVAGIVGAIAVACSSSVPAASLSPTPQPTAEPNQQIPLNNPEDINPTPEPQSPTPVPAIPSVVDVSGGYDPSDMMFRLFPGFATVAPDKLKAALQEVEERNDITQIPVLIESIRFLSSSNSREAAASTLRALTGEEFNGEQWFEWMQWYGKRRDEIRPPARYVDWKINFMNQIDPRFRQFLTPAKEFSAIDLTELLWGGVIPDGIPDLLNPPTIPAPEADYLGSDERVFGVTINGHSRAYPLRILNAHEMANDVVGGEPVSLSWCTLCASGILYSSIIDGNQTSFGTSGMLFRSNKVMYDRATNTLWSQQTGKPIIGPLAQADVSLELLPLQLTTWGEWLEENPDTDVLSLSTGFYSPTFYAPEDDSESFYFDYRAQADTMFPVWSRDDRLDTKDEVLGLTFGEVARAYPVTTLNEERIINDTLEGVDIVIIASAESSNARVYKSEGRIFSVPESETDNTGIFGKLVDANGVEWEVTNEALVNVKDRSQKLALVPANISFWFGWFSFNMETEIYGIDSN